MVPSNPLGPTSCLRRIGYCLLPMLLGSGAALVLLVVASRPVKPAYAANLTYPGCALTIQSCIDNANAGDTILISAGNYTESLTLSKAVSLTGALSSTTILHALPNTRVLTVTGAAVDSSVIISGLTFAGGHAVGTICPAGCGGAILITATAQPLLSNLTISNSVADLFGGGLYADTGSPLVMSGVAVLNNTVTGYGSGGGVYAIGRVTLNGGLFQDNHCTGFVCSGGGLFSNSNLVVTNTQFLSNTTTYIGGGAEVLGSATLNGGVFQDNQGGGLFSVGDLAMTNTQFLSNTSGSAGGGAYASGNAILNGGLFQNNNSSLGGGLFAQKSLTATNTQFLSNTSLNEAGGAEVGADAVLNGDIFQNNECSGPFCRGGGLFAEASLTATNTLFLGNRGQSGAGLYHYSGGARLVNDLFAANQAGGLGDALYLASPGSVVILHNTIASPTLGSGAAIVVANGTVGITDTIVASYTTGISQTAGSVLQDYNLFFGNGTNTAGTVSGGAHSLAGDPLFANPAGGPSGYHLGSSSAAIDIGTNAGVTTDFEGDPRPQGGGFDIGFDESPNTAVADVGLTKSASASVRQPGQTLTYTLVFSNAGPNIAAGVRLTDIVPANLVAVTYTSSGAALTPVGVGSYAWQVASLAPGVGGIVTVTGVLTGGLHGTVFTNTATITSPYSDTNPANNTSAVSVTVANVPPAALDDAYPIAENITLTVAAPGVLGNDSDANGDPLTAVLLSSPPTGTLNLQADGSFTYTPPLDYLGVVTFTYQANDGLAGSNSATVTLTVLPFVANVGVTKSASASRPVPGELLTYTLVYSNAGPSVAAGVRLTDIVPANLTNLSVASSGSVITATAGLTYAWQVADLAPGAGGVVTVTGVLSGGLNGSVFTNTASVTTTTFDSVSGNNTSAVGVAVANLIFPGCAASIQACIDSASPGDTILINAGDYTEGLTLSKAVSLTGALSSTTILHAPPNMRVLTVTGAAVNSSVVISGLTFAGGHAVGTTCPAGCGGAILITATAHPLLTNLTISNSVADLFGGGLYVNPGSGLMLSGTAVLSNTSSGFFGVTSGGGGVYNGGSLNLFRSTISNNNAATYQGGGVYNAGSLAVYFSTISHNHSSSYGGGVFNSAALTLISSAISGNSGTGAVYNASYLAISGSTISGNLGSGVYSDFAFTTITGSTISNNSAGSGGGVYLNYGTLTLASSSISGNTASSGGGLYDNNSLSVSVTNSTITSNTATSYGGGVYNNYGALAIANSSISNNQATYGGGIWQCCPGALSITSSTISGNTATNGDGGGLYNDGYLFMISSTVTSNMAIGVNHRGGGIFSAGTLIVTSSTISNNTAYAGGGLYNWNGPVTLSGSTVGSNAASYGGAVFIANFFSTGDNRLVNALVTGNSASQAGAALYLASPGSVEIVHSTIASPTQDGGAAIVVVSGTVGITDTIIASYTTGISLTAGSVFQDYNLFFGNGTNTTGAVSGSAHSLTGDPAFVNPAGGPSGYHIGSGSLAIDAGANAGVTTDFDGETRPQGSGFDIGFDESPYTALADVGVKKSASAGMQPPGQMLTYTLVYSNAGPQVAAAVLLTDIVPANLSAVTYTSSGAALTPVGGQTYAWQTANLAPGAGGIITVTGVLSGGLQGTVFTNTATITTTTDSNAANDTSAVSVTIANGPPVAADNAYTLSVNSTWTVTAPGVLGNDTDANNDPLTAILAAGPLTGTLDLHADGSFTYTPPLGYSGVVSFTYRANDGLADSNTATAAITVTPIANVGLVKSASASLLAPGQLLTYTLVFSNAGPSLAAGVRLTDSVPANLMNLSATSSGAVITATGGLTYAWQVADLAPGAGGLVTVTGVLSGSPTGTVFTNTATITTTTADSDASNSTSAVSVTVANVPPAAVDNAYTLSVNSPLTITAPGVLGNDSDANGDPLTAVLAAGPLTGTLNLHADGSFTYTPALGYSGVVTFTYRANDGLADSNTALVTLTVTTRASVGLVKSASASLLAPGQYLTYTLVFSNTGPGVAAGVRLTDIVPANLVAITYTSSGAVITPTGGLTYAWQAANLAPGAGGIITVTGVLASHARATVFTNTAAITTTTADSDASNDTSAVSVTVANVPPVAADDAYTVTGNNTLTMAAPGVLANDTDANNDPLTANLVAGPLTGTLSLRADGSFAYTPPLGYSGVVTFTDRANDVLADSNTAIVTLTVASPVTNLGLVKSASASLLAPGQRLTYTLVFSNAGPSLAAGVRLTDIVPANLTAITYTSSGAVLTPVGGQTYAWQVANLAPGAGGVVTVTGVLNGGWHGTVFTNTATITSPYSDSNPANNASAISVTIANALPMAPDDAYIVTGNTTLTVTAPGVLANDTDANNDLLTTVLAAGPVTGTLSLHADGSFTYTPPHGFAGVVMFTYRAKDGLADSNIATVTITVTAASYELYLPLVMKP